MKRTYGLVFTAALLLAGSAFAQEPPLDRFEFHVPVGPAPGGWYSPESNFGGITFDVNIDPARPVMNGEWTYQVDGAPKTIFFQSTLAYSSRQAIYETGVLATFDSPTFTFTGRADYANPMYGGTGQVVLTGRHIRIEFISSRAGTFIDNPGQPDERRFPVVATLRGPPLVAAANYSGDWMVVGRRESLSGHRQTQVQWHLEPVEATNGYRVIAEVFPNGPPAPYGKQPPQPGARLYRVTCSSGVAYACDDTSFTPTCGGLCVTGSNFTLLWVNPDETSEIEGVTREANGTIVIYDIGYPPTTVFAKGDSLVGRRDEVPLGLANALTELQALRLPTGIYEEVPPPPRSE